MLTHTIQVPLMSICSKAMIEIFLENLRVSVNWEFVAQSLVQVKHLSVQVVMCSKFISFKEKFENNVLKLFLLYDFDFIEAPKIFFAFFLPLSWIMYRHNLLLNEIIGSFLFHFYCVRCLPIVSFFFFFLVYKLCLRSQYLSRLSKFCVDHWRVWVSDHTN